MANTIVKFHLLTAPAIACEMGISPVLESISKAIIRRNISLGVRVYIQVIKTMAMKPLPRPSRNSIYSSGQPSLMFNIEKAVLSLHPFFIYPHRKDISHEHNPDAPRERNPDVITDRLS